LNTIKISGVIFVFMILSVVSFAGNQQDTDEEIPPWMEKVEMKGKNAYLVPKGTKRKMIGAHIVAESPNEYAARRIFEIEKSLEVRLEAIEKKQEEFQDKLIKELERIKETIKELEKKVSIEKNSSEKF